MINAPANECNTSLLDVSPRVQQAKIVNQRDEHMNLDMFLHALRPCWLTSRIFLSHADLTDFTEGCIVSLAAVGYAECILLE